MRPDGKMKSVVREPGLVVMVGDSCSKGHGFETQHSILDGHLFCCEICNVCLKRRK